MVGYRYQGRRELDDVNEREISRSPYYCAKRAGGSSSLVESTRKVLGMLCWRKVDARWRVFGSSRRRKS